MSTAAPPSPAHIPAAEALQRLLDGNRRYVSARLENAGELALQRAACAAEQNPIAVVLGCSDSRVPPSMIFDQGPGGLFTTRVAGNVADDAVLASIEYAVVQLQVPLVVVLGHTRCGAVGACLAGVPVEGHLGVLMSAICPAVEQARRMEGDLLDNAIRANVAATVARVRSSGPLLAPRVAGGDLVVVGALYDLDTGAVEVLA
jgi:carbonic anhydrase